LFMFINSQSQSGSESGSVSHMVRYGIPAALILFGFIKLLSGRAVNETAFNALIGDDSKDIGDDIESFMCHSCGEQLLTEISQNKCPKCGNLIE